MQRALLLATMFALALSPACYFEPSLSAPRDSGGDSGDSGGGDAPTDMMPDMPTIPADAPPLLAAGRSHACRVTPEAQLRCWGSNQFGELNATSSSDTGTAVVAFAANPTFATGWITVGAGFEYTCGIIDMAGTRKVYCWGRNTYGTVDPTSPGSGATPVHQIALPNFEPARIFAGDEVACAISTTGALRCWGNVNFASPSGSAGLTTITHPSGTAFAAVAIADTHACALDTDGVALCWGRNTHRALGQNDTSFVALASGIQPIAENVRFTSLAASHDITCGTTTVGALACWGTGANGHLGVMGATDSPYTEVDATRTYVRVATGRSHACAVATGSTAGTYCYGDEAGGALGSGLFTRDFLRTDPVMGLGTTAQITANDLFSCALETNGTNRCWGANPKGQLGNKEVARKRTTPSTVDFSNVVTGQVTIQSIMAGDNHTCALVGDTAPYAVKCWGDNRNRQVTTVVFDETVPKPASSGDGFEQLATGGNHSCAMTQNGTAITCWGANGAGQATSHNMPGADRWTYVAAGSTTTCAIADGRLHCWGSVFNNTTTTTPVVTNGIGGETGWQWETVTIGSGFLLGAVLDPSGPTYHVGVWGQGCPAGLATGSTVNPADEQFAGRVFNAKPRLWAADQSGSHSCAHWTYGSPTATTEFVCFGMNTGKQVSESHVDCDGTEAVSVAVGSVPASSAPDLARVAVANTHSCAITTSGQLMCWGANNNSELGPLNLFGASGTPMRLGTVTYAEVATGFEHTCAVTADRHTVHCWGENRLGQAGDGSQWRPSPVVAGEL